MQKVEAYRVEIPIVAIDEYSQQLDRASKSLDEIKKKAKDSAKAQDDLSNSSKKVDKSHDGVAKSAKDASKGVQEVGKSAEQTEKRFQRTIKVFESFGSKMKALQRAKATVEVAVKDNATRVLNRVHGTWDGFRRDPIIRLSVYAVDRATGILHGVKNMITSIPTLITIGLSYVGIKNLSDSTVGAAMRWEQYEVSMQHWLDGNVKQAKELTKWMGEFADYTPFSSPELFPALTQAVSISDKDIAKSKRLLGIASDMAALTPGRTVEDAMQAIASSKVGNNVMLQGFGLKITKKDMDEMGGWEKLLDKLEKEFKGGAEKLSKTAAGVLATLRGYRGSFMRSIGTGFLEPMKPRLDAINQWLADNQEKWARWKSVAMGHGEDLSEGIFSTLEKGFGYIQRRYLENPDFMNLDLKGKISFISSDVSAYMNQTIKPKLMEWWQDTGSGVAIEIGKTIGSGIVEGIKLGIQGGAQLFTTSWKELLANMEEDVFSLETGKSALGALATTAGAAYLGKKLIYNPGKAIYKGGKAVIGQGKKFNDWSKKSDERGVKRQAKFEESNQRRIKRRMARAEEKENKPAARAEKKENKRQRRSGKLGFMSQAPGGGGGPLKLLGKLGGPLRALSLLNLVGEDGIDFSALPQIGAGWAGAAAGGAAGAAVGSFLGPLGTIGGGIIGSIIGGLGGDEFYKFFEDSLFNGEWWSSKWQSIKEITGRTIFNAGWWGEQAGFVWGKLESTLFSGEWWNSKWGNVKNWTSETIDGFSDAWEKTKNNAAETLFNGQWWNGKWVSVKNWASETTAGFSDVWEKAKSKAAATLFSAEWWSSKWSQVQSWASNTWGEIKSGFQLGRNKANKRPIKTSNKSPYGSPTPYAKGGIATKPHLGLVAEAGVPEAMIPWDGSSRSKALWQQTGEALGMFDDNTSNRSTSKSVAKSASNSFSSGGNSLTFNIGDITVGQGNNMSAEEILNTIIPVLYEKIVAALAKR